jgi:mannose/fructose/N-acetylgalactosamine-specific phosphotransferase system component IID
MGGYFLLVAVLVVLVVAYQIYISRRVARDTDYTDQQRLLQLIMIWVLPVLGAALCQAMLSDGAPNEIADEGVDDHAGADHSAGDD